MASNGSVEAPPCRVPRGFSVDRWKEVVQDALILYDQILIALDRGDIDTDFELLDLFGVDDAQLSSPYGRSLVLRMCGRAVRFREGAISFVNADGSDEYCDFVNEIEEYGSTTCSKFIWDLVLRDGSLVPARELCPMAASAIVVEARANDLVQT